MLATLDIIVVKCSIKKSPIVARKVVVNKKTKDARIDIIHYVVIYIIYGTSTILPAFAWIYSTCLLATANQSPVVV